MTSMFSPCCRTEHRSHRVAVVEAQRQRRHPPDAFEGSQSQWRLRSMAWRREDAGRIVGLAKHELLFAVLANPWDAKILFQLDSWRQKSKFAVCYVAELWEVDFDTFRDLKRIFPRFDLILSGSYAYCSAASRITGTNVVYIPPGVDAIALYISLVHAARRSIPCSRTARGACQSNSTFSTRPRFDRARPGTIP